MRVLSMPIYSHYHIQIGLLGGGDRVECYCSWMHIQFRVDHNVLRECA